MRDDLGKRLEPAEALARLRKYLDAAAHYEQNVGKLLSMLEATKAGEVLWGSAASALKAFALAQTNQLLGRGEIDVYGKNLAREMRLEDEFRAIRTLHVNFYDPFLAEDEIRTLADKGLRFVAKVSQAAAAKSGLTR